MSSYAPLLSQKQITSAELELLLAARRRGEVDFLLVDVREPYEYEAGHIEGVDLLLPTTRFQSWAPIVQADYRDRTLILTCRTSNRTAQVQGILLEAGMQNVVDHTGGIVEYTGEIVTGMEGARYV